jgi:AcrR family transcriptional regulator
MSNKENIVFVALELFGEQGYDRTPTAQIARQAGVSEGLIFRHFGSKSGLLAAIIHEGLAHIAATMTSYAELSAEPRDAILQHIERSLSAIRAEEKFWRLATKMRFQTEVLREAAAEIEKVNQYVLQHLSDNFRRLGAASPEHEALLLFALIDGVCLHWLQNPAEYPLEAMKNLLVKKYHHANF